MTSHALDEAPIAAINTTPLIDVMLVLLIMFIITIPVATDSIDIDLPRPEYTGPAAPNPVRNKVVLTPDGAILWNGSAVTRQELSGLLGQTLRMPVEPELQFEPNANASYDLAAGVLGIIKKSGVTRFGFVGNERFATFAR